MDKKKKKTIGGILGVVVAVLISVIRPPEGLTPEAMRAMGIFAGAIVFLSMDVFPSFVTTTLMCTCFALFKCVSFSVAFGEFSGTTFWLIIGVLGIGVAINKCGLMKRISYYALKLFPPTFNGITAALLGVGTVCQPLMPSTTAKMAIVGPLAMDLGQTLGFEKHSKPLAGFFNAMYVGWSITGTVFISASFLGYLFQGNLPADVQAQFTWMRWFIAMIPWAIIVVIGNYFTLTKIYKPKEQQTINKDYIENQIKALGPMSRDEKIVCAIMAVALVMWILERKIGVSACLTSLICLMAMSIIGIFKPGDFATKMSWPLIFFIGGILNISKVIGALDISNWVGKVIEPFLGGLISKPLLFTVVFVLVIYVVRYIMVNFSTLVILFTVILTPVAQASGMNPWVVMMIAYCSVCIWVTKYQNSNMLAGWAMCGGDDTLNFSDVMPGAYAHLIVNLVALLVSIPYWQMLGYIG